MPPIDLDLSPLLINRTAVYNIGRDVAEILTQCGDFDVRYRFFGRTFDEWPDREREQALLDRLEQARLAAATDRLCDRGRLGDRHSDRSGGEPRAFILDPLYVLFAPLSPRDIVVCHDLSVLTNPEWHDATTASLYREAFRRILAIGPRLIAVSQHTADTLYANFGTYRRGVTVVHNYLPRLIADAAGTASFPPLHAATPYFLFVGSLEARKNVIGAIDAFALSELAAEGYRLVLVGGEGQGAAEIQERAGEVRGIILAGFQSGEALCSIYAGATGFLYPSYLEGFGVPLLEAMAFGLPCIATTCGASPEVGGPFVRYRDPDDAGGLAEELRAITRLAHEQRCRIAAGLRRRAHSEFSYTKFADRLLAVVRDKVEA